MGRDAGKSWSSNVQTNTRSSLILSGPDVSISRSTIWGASYVQVSETSEKAAGGGLSNTPQVGHLMGHPARTNVEAQSLVTTVFCNHSIYWRYS